MSSINFNLNPYYDDFVETKNFHRFLFKPGYAVQARELTQLQTVLQNQIDKFGKHIFKEGSIVLGGQFNLENDVDTIRLTDGAGTNTDLNTLVGKIIVGQTNGLRAFVHGIAFKTEWGETDDILMLRYLSTSVAASTFVAGEQLTIEGQVAPITQIVKATTPTGKGTIFTIQEGTVFTKGFFVNFETQKIILSPTNQFPTMKVGFTNLEEIVNSSQDASLLDPALGSYNYSAPGSDRLKVTATLTKLDIDDDTTLPDFTTLFILKDGQIIEINERTQYDRIYDELAKRTFDESGDYVVRGLGLRIREHLDTGTNDGYLPAANSGNINLLAVGVEPGVGYVKGYEINNLTTRYLTIDKSNSFERVDSEILFARSGNYIGIEQVVGTLKLDTAQQVTLYNTAEQRVSNVSSTSSTTPIGSAIGTAKVKNIEYSGSGSYNLYLFDIKMTGANTFSNVRSVYSSENNGFFADVKLSFGEAILEDTAQNLLMVSLGSDFIRSVREDDDSSSDTSFTFKRSEDITINEDGTFTVEVTQLNETHSYGTSGTLSDLEKLGMILTLRNTSPFSNTLTGTVSTTSGQNTVVGVGTTFEYLNVNDIISITDVAGTYRIASIANNTHLTVSSNIPTTVATKTFSKVYNTGDIIDLTTKGRTTGVERSVTVSTNKILNFDLKETFSTTVPATITYNVSRSNAKEIKKDLIPHIHVQINCAALSSLTDPINLGVSDVFKLRQIRIKSGGAFTSNTEGTLVTDNFILDNGQRDDFYDHAKIRPKTSFLTATDYLLIELDYFKPNFTNGFGYFSVDSYPIDDDENLDNYIKTHEIPIYKSVSGSTYPLRRYLDFRPVKTNTATDATTASGASVNPATTDSFNLPANGLRIPNPTSQIVCDYSYYLARRDVVVCSTDGTFSVITGVPSITPLTPTISDNVMGVANIFIPPYPSLATTYARILNKEKEGVQFEKITNRRFTMKDIGVLKQRIENLEYYNALTLLEKDAVDLLILDELGNDRFKNGFFVDGFLDHSLGATANPDYNITVDRKETVIRPRFKMDSLYFNSNAALSSNIQKTGNLITLPYTETVLLEQSRVTTIRNIEQSVYRFVGNITLTPDIDVWMDDTVVDKIILNDNDLPSSDYMTTEYGSWQTYQTGVTTYNVYSRNFGDRSNDLAKATLVGSFTSLAEATAAQKNVTRGYIETVYSPDSTQVRTNVLTAVNIDTTTQQLGTFVQNVSVIPYIRPQTIEIVVQGLKPNTVFYTYFDGENMSSYISPRVLPNEIVVNPATSPVAAEGSVWRSNQFGVLAARLRLPSTGKRFRVGQKEVIVTDSPTNASDATSYAKNYFYANGIHVSKENTIVSTRTATSTTTPVTEVVGLQNTVQIFGPSCMAYSFYVDVPQDEDGIFLTSVDVFVSQVHPTLGVWFEIREMSPDGGISRTQVPYSEVWYRSDEVTVTDDATTPHEVVFPSPVFLRNKTQYAFVIHTEGLNPDTYFWVSRLGETDIITNTPVTGRQLTGSLYTTNNNLNWDIVPDVDLKVRFNRAVFATGTGTAVIGNKPYEFLNVTDINQIFSSYGETVNSSQTLNLTGITGTIYAGNTITQGTNTANVISVSGSSYLTDGFAFNVALGSITANSGATANISSITQGSGTLFKYDQDDSIVILSDSNGAFEANAKITGVSSSSSGKISSIGEYLYSTINYKPRFIQFYKTQAFFDFNGIDSALDVYDGYRTFTPDTSPELFKEFVVKSRSVEITDYASSNSTLLRATLSTNSEYVSPVIDVPASHCVFVKNIINDDDTDENSVSGGNLINKYISKTVTLAEQQDAEDLFVRLTAYVPPGSGVKVWMKIRHNEDSQTIDLRPWQEMTSTAANVFSSTVDTNDFKEYTFTVPTSMMTGPSEEVQYTSSTGTVFTGFKQFTVKIGLLGSDTSKVPRVGDLRVIALQK